MNKQRLQRIVQKFLKIKTGIVYCTESRKEQEASYIFLFGFLIKTTYTNIEEPVLGI